MHFWDQKEGVDGLYKELDRSCFDGLKNVSSVYSMHPLTDQIIVLVQNMQVFQKLL